VDAKLQKKIEDRIEQGTLRSLPSYEGMIDFVSNDYLGLSTVKSKFSSPGSTGSRLIAGNSRSIEEIESNIASFFNWNSALCFNSGYTANLAIFSSIPQKGDIVLFDQCIHASTRDGIRLSLAQSYSFKHNNLEDLKRLLDKFSGSTIYIAVEALYSMDGDFCPLKELTDLSLKYNSKIILDEAHSCGIYGGNGKGLSAELDLDNQIYIKLVTFGKAYGGHGACVLSESDIKTYLINFARPFIYSTALPYSDYQFMLDVISCKEQNDNCSKLSKNISLFREHVNQDLLFSDSKSPIQIIRMREINQLKEIETSANLLNIAVKVIYSPTVLVGQECIRVCIHSFNSVEEIKLLAGVIKSQHMHA